MLDLYIDRKAYYNLIRGKPLEDGISNDLFEGLVLALEEVGFRFIYLISDKLVNNISIKRYCGGVEMTTGYSNWNTLEILQICYGRAVAAIILLSRLQHY